MSGLFIGAYRRILANHHPVLSRITPPKDTPLHNLPPLPSPNSSETGSPSQPPTPQFFGGWTSREVQPPKNRPKNKLNSSPDHAAQTWALINRLVREASGILCTRKLATHTPTFFLFAKAALNCKHPRLLRRTRTVKQRLSGCETALLKSTPQTIHLLSPHRGSRCGCGQLI